MSRNWTVDRIWAGDPRIRIRNVHSAERWLLDELGQHKAQLEGVQVAYTFQDGPRDTRQTISLTLDLGENDAPDALTLLPGEELQLLLDEGPPRPLPFWRGRLPFVAAPPLPSAPSTPAEPTPLKRTVPLPRPSDPAFAERRHVASGDILTVTDRRGRLVSSQMAAAHPLALRDWLNVAWHAREGLSKLARSLAAQFYAADLTNKASAMSYSTMMVLVPFLLLLVVVFTQFEDQDVGPALEKLIVNVVAAGGNADGAKAEAERYLAQLKNQIGINLMMGVFGVFGMALFWQSLTTYLNAIRGSPAVTGPAWRGILFNLLTFPGLVFAGYALARAIIWAIKKRDELLGFVSDHTVTVILIALLAGGGLVAALQVWLAPGSPLRRWLPPALIAVVVVLAFIPSLLITAAFGFLTYLALVCVLFLTYLLGPTMRPRPREALVGGLIAATLLVALYFALGRLAGNWAVGMFGPAGFIPLALLAGFLGWLAFFFGAYLAYSDWGATAADRTAEAAHIRCGILLALEREGSLTVARTAALLGADPARVWTEALAMQSASAGEPLVHVGLDCTTGHPKLSLDNRRDDPTRPGEPRPQLRLTVAQLMASIVGPRDLLSFRQGCDSQLSQERESLMAGEGRRPART